MAVPFYKGEIMTEGEERREYIIQLLTQTKKPISGTELAKQVQVYHILTKKSSVFFKLFPVNSLEAAVFARYGQKFPHGLLLQYDNAFRL